MVFSKIINNEVAYYDLYAETCLNNSCEDISVKEKQLTNTIIDNIYNDIVFDTQSKYFVLNFDEILSIPSINPFDKKLSDLINREHKKIVLSNIEENVLHTISNSDYFTQQNSEHKKADSSRYEQFIIGEHFNIELSNHDSLFEEILKNKLAEHIDSKGHNSSSSFVKLTSYIKLKELLTNEKEFMLYAIYVLSKKVKAHWSAELRSDNKPVLICHSLNGSYIATVLSNILNLDMFVLDQIGPINKLYRNLGKEIEPDKKYIIVSDMVCLGTEVRITKSIIEYLGGEYLGNVSIVRLDSFEKYQDVEYLFVIDKTNCGFLKYETYTALNQNTNEHKK